MNVPHISHSPGWSRLALPAVLALAAVTHLSAIGVAEFTGEDEVLFLNVCRHFVAALFQDAGGWRELTDFYYPPLQWALPALPVRWFGPAEWTVRLPGALAGVAAAGLLFVLIAEQTRDRRKAALAGLLAAVGGVAANHYYALTCGLFAFFALVGAWGLARFIEAPDERAADRALWLGALGSVGAMMTLQDGYFYLPVLAAAYWSRRRFRLPRGAWLPLALVVAWIALYVVVWIVLPGARSAGTAGGMFKIRLILSHLGACRLGDLALSFVAGSSWPAAALALVLLPLGWREAPRGLRWVAVYYGFPLALWTFVFGYANVRAAHLLLGFSGFALLWALGAVRVADRLRGRPAAARAWRVLAGLAVAATAWQTFTLHVSDRIPERWANPPGVVLRDYYPQGRRVETFGQPAAGWWVQRHSRADAGVACNLGGSFADFYAMRPDRGGTGLAAGAADPARARAVGLRYYAHAVAGAAPPTGVDLAALPVALEVRAADRPVLRVYDLWREPGVTELMDAREGRRRFEERRRMQFAKGER